MLSKKALMASLTAEPVIAPDFIVTIASSGTLAFTYDVDTKTLTNVTGTTIPSGSPLAAGGYEGVATNGRGTAVVSAGWYQPLRCATFDVTSSGLWTMTPQSGLPIGSSGNRFGSSPCINSRANHILASSYYGTYYSTLTNSWTNLASGAYERTAAGHNRFYVAFSNSNLSCYAGTGAPSFISSINCGSANRMRASERTYDPNSYTNPPTNEIIVVSGATSAIVLYTASTNTYSVLRQGSVSDGLPTTYGAGVTRDGTRAVFASGSRAYIYDIDPDAGTASLLTDFPIAYGVGSGGDVDIFPSGNMIAVMDTSTMGIYDLDGVLQTSITAGTYGMTCVYDGVNATA